MLPDEVTIDSYGETKPELDPFSLKRAGFRLLCDLPHPSLRDAARHLFRVSDIHDI